jgi:Mg2+/Co2+ transporter CorB
VSLIFQPFEAFYRGQPETYVDPSLLISIVAIIILLVLSAFFSGSETALTAASRARLHHLENKGNRRAKTVGRLSEQKDRLIGAILLGNNLVNILASALATSILISYFGDAGVAYATIAMTALVLIFAEIMPKTYALRHADRTALAVAPIISAFVFILSPVTRSLQVIVRLCLRLVGIDVRASEQLTSAAEEIRSTVDLHSMEGSIVKHERDMIGSILDLSDVALDEIMIHRKNMELINAADPTSQIVDQVLGSSYTRLPIYRHDADDIIGVLHAKDVLRAVSAHEGPLNDLDIVAVATDPWFVPETTTLREQLNAFRKRRAHFALIVDEYGALMGLVTLEDILEEIVGDISDEHDEHVAGVRKEADGSYVIDGTMTIRDLNRLYDWDLPDEEASTIAGLVVYEAAVIPVPGQVFTFHNFRFEILRRQRNQIVKLRITPPAVTPRTAR